MKDRFRLRLKGRCEKFDPVECVFCKNGFYFLALSWGDIWWMMSCKVHDSFIDLTLEEFKRLNEIGGLYQPLELRPKN